MPWFKVDDGFASCRPVLAIPRRYRAQAVGLWLMAGTWSARELTDGFIPEYLLDELASTPAMAAHLVRAGLFEEASGGYQLIGWAKYQPTKEQVYARRSEEAQRKQRAREARRKQSDQQEPESVRNVSHPDTVRSPQRVRPVSEHPDPTRPDPTPFICSYFRGGGCVSRRARTSCQMSGTHQRPVTAALSGVRRLPPASRRMESRAGFAPPRVSRTAPRTHRPLQ